MKLYDLGIKYNTDKAYNHNFCDFYEKDLLIVILDYIQRNTMIY